MTVQNSIVNFEVVFLLNFFIIIQLPKIVS